MTTWYRQAPPQYDGDEEDSYIKVGVARRCQPIYDDDGYDCDDDDEEDEDYRYHVQMLRRQIESVSNRSIKTVSSASLTPQSPIMSQLKQPPQAPPPPPPPPPPAVRSPDVDEKALYRQQLGRAQDIVAQHYGRQERLSENHNSYNSSSSLWSLSENARLQRATQPGAVSIPGPPDNYIAARPTIATFPSTTVTATRHYGVVEYVLRTNPETQNAASPVMATSEEQITPLATAAPPESSIHHNITNTTTTSSHHRRSVVRYKQERRMWYLGATASCCMLALVGVLIGFIVHNHNMDNNRAQQNGSSPSATSTTTSTSENGITRFDPFTTDCSVLLTQTNPHVLTQCRCLGTISHLANDIVDHYHLLLSTWMPTVSTDSSSSSSNNNAPEILSLQSCHAQNQALVWLASGDGGVSARTTKFKLRQRYLMAFLFITWNGPEWQLTATPWLSSNDECTWVGISCSINGNDDDGTHNSHNSRDQVVTGITLNHVNLQGQSIPSEIGLLTSLQSLMLSTTGLNGTIPAELFSATALNVLDLTGNSLAGTIPTQIGQLQQLERLLFSNNALSGTIPTEVCDCTSLHQIEIADNKLNGTIPNCLGSLSSLTLMCFGGNQITGQLPRTVHVNCDYPVGERH